MSDSGFDPADFFGLRRSRGSRPRVVRSGPRLTRGRRIAIAVLAAAVLLVVAFFSLMGLRVQYLFLDSLGHSNVFWTPILTKALTFLAGAVVTGGIVGACVRGWVRAAATVDERTQPYSLWAGIGVAVLAGLSGGAFLSARWQEVLLFLHHQDFHTSEPVFGMDIGYWVFQLPFYDAVQGVLWGGVITGLVVTVGLGAACVVAETAPSELPFPLRPPKGVSPREGFAICVRQAGILVAAVFLLAAAGAHFGVYHLATDVHDQFVGLDATQRDVVRPILGALQYVALALAFVTVALVVRRWNSADYTAGIALGVVLGGWLVGAGLLQTVPASIYSAARVNPNASTLQLPFVRDYIIGSRNGWALNQPSQVDSRSFGVAGQGASTVTVSDLAADPVTLQNVRVQDERQVPAILSNIDKNRRAYQTYPSAMDDRYPAADGNDRAIIISPREIEQANLPQTNFANQSFVFTHGYGVTAVSVNQLTTSNDPQVLLGGQPPLLTSGAPSGLLVSDPRIYCGLEETHPVIVNTTTSEFDYVGPNGDQQTQYGNNGNGIPVPGLLDRLAISIDQFNGLDLVFTSGTTAQSVILLHREVTDRVLQLAPWLTVDSDPYIVADQSTGHYDFIVDAYVKTGLVPESFQDSDGTSYMRNAVKAVVDARTCKTTLYAVDMTEPLTAAYNDIYPGLLTPLSQMPMALRAHLRYPKDLFSAQSRAFAQAHVDPSRAIDLYTGTDVYRAAQESGADSVSGSPVDTTPHYVELVLPGEERPSFVLLQTFSPNQTSSGGSSNAMTAWLAAECDYTGTSLPRLVAVPLGGSGVQGPLQFDNKLNTNTQISQTVTLLNGSGSKVSYGDVIVLPFNNRGFLYVRALYVSANGRYPQINKVLVGNQDSVAQGNSFADAMQNLYPGQDISSLHLAGVAASSPTQVSPGGSPSPGASPSPSPSGSPSPSPGPGAAVTLTPQQASLLADLLQREQAAQQDLARQDYTAYGADVAAEQKDLAALRLQLGPSFGASPSPTPAVPASSPTPSPSP